MWLHTILVTPSQKGYTELEKVLLVFFRKRGGPNDHGIERLFYMEKSQDFFGLCPLAGEMAIGWCGGERTHDRDLQEGGMGCREKNTRNWDCQWYSILCRWLQVEAGQTSENIASPQHIIYLWNVLLWNMAMATCLPYFLREVNRFVEERSTNERNKSKEPLLSAGVCSYQVPETDSKEGISPSCPVSELPSEMAALL